MPCSTRRRSLFKHRISANRAHHVKLRSDANARERDRLNPATKSNLSAQGRHKGRLTPARRKQRGSGESTPCSRAAHLAQTRSQPCYTTRRKASESSDAWQANRGGTTCRMYWQSSLPAAVAKTCPPVTSLPPDLLREHVDSVKVTATQACAPARLAMCLQQLIQLGLDWFSCDKL